MAKQTINTLKSWFRTGLKPLQQQFWDWLDSYWHKDEKVPISTVDGLPEVLNNLVTEDAIRIIEEHQVDLQLKFDGLMPLVSAPGQISLDISQNKLVEKIMILDQGNPLVTILAGDDGTDITDGGLALENGWATLQKDMFFKNETRLYFNNITPETIVKIFTR